mgnify:CR=1 FL=1
MVSLLYNFNPLESWRGFQEGNAMQYTFFVPQNPARLIEKSAKMSLTIGWILSSQKPVSRFLVVEK